MRKYSIHFFSLIIVLLIGIAASAQTTKIIGIVKDSISGEPLPFVNVQLEGTQVGATTGFDGQYIIETQARGEAILISYVGYVSQRHKVKKGSFQEINVLMASSNIELAEVTIVPGENPAHRILRKTIENKELNSRYNLDAFQYKVYNKIQIDANNITDDFKNRKAMKPFQFVFDNIDTSTINGKSYLPLLLSETISDYYYRQSPEAKKEVILASRASGINNSSVSQFLGGMYQSINIYENYLVLFDKNFVSPISDFGLRTYRYYLVDSAAIDGLWCYKLMFKPKRKQELTFTGEIWITDSTFAVKEVDMKIEDVNLNFVNAMSIKLNYHLLHGQYWMKESENFVVDFNVVENTKRVSGFYGHKTTYYKDIIINKVLPDERYKTNVSVEVAEGAWEKNEEYWDTSRFVQLNNEELTIYKMVDTVVNMPAFKTLYDIIAMFATGYYNTEKFDIGPYYTMYSFNGVEGHRFRMGGRTSNQWNERIRLYGHLAYGTLDNEMKYGFGGTYILNKNPRRAYDVNYKKDMEQLGESVRALRQDNILSSVFRSSPNNSLTMVEQFKTSFEYEYFNGFSNEITYSHRQMFPLQDSKFEIYEQGKSQTPTSYNSLITSEIEFKTHFAYREVFLVDKFNRVSLGSKYPEFNLWYAYGIPNLIQSQFEYHKLQLSVQQWFNVGTIGYTRYIVSWGKVWGDLPYPILEVHPGNETFSYDDFAFSRMNYYEFISDEYFTANLSHNFQGLLFNHIPLMRKLKWREVVYGKVLMGTLSNTNQNYSTFPSNTTVLTKPYYEVGAAIENIFKIIRIDASWRLSYLDKKDVRPFGIMASLHFDF